MFQVFRKIKIQFLEIKNSGSYYLKKLEHFQKIYFAGRHYKLSDRSLTL